MKYQLSMKDEYSSVLLAVSAIGFQFLELPPKNLNEVRGLKSDRDLQSTSTNQQRCLKNVGAPKLDHSLTTYLVVYCLIYTLILGHLGFSSIPYKTVSIVLLK